MVKLRSNVPSKCLLRQVKTKDGLLEWPGSKCASRKIDHIIGSAYNTRVDLVWFLPRDGMHKRGTSCRPVSVCLSATLVYCIQTAKDVRLVSRWGSPIILVCEPIQRYSIPSGTSSARALSRGWVTKIRNFRPGPMYRNILKMVKDSPICLYGTLIGSQRYPIDQCQFRWSLLTLKCKELNVSGGSP